MSGSELRPGPGGPIRSAKALIRRHLYKARHGAIVSAVTSHPASALPGSICPRSSPTSASMSRVSFSFMATTRDAVCRPWRDSPSRVDRPGDRTARRKKEYLTAHHVPCLRSRSAVHCWAMIGRTTPTSAHNASDQIRKLRPAEWVQWSICAAKILSRACRLWVISGKARPEHLLSAIPLTANFARSLRDRRLCARSGLVHRSKTATHSIPMRGDARSQYFMPSAS